jgi:hypothetical protein
VEEEVHGGGTHRCHHEGERIVNCGVLRILEVERKHLVRHRQVEDGPARARNTFKRKSTQAAARAK